MRKFAWAISVPLAILGACSSSSGDPGSGGPGPGADGGLQPDGAPATTQPGHPQGDGGVVTGPHDGGSSTHTDSGTTPPPPTGFDAGAITGLNGKTYYVSASGKDSNAGSSAAPWATIQQAGMALSPGDTLIVMAGTYDGAIFGWDPAGSGVSDQIIAGTATNPILIEADPAAAAGSVVIASRNKQNANGIDLEPGCDYVIIKGFTVTNAGTASTKAGTITHAGIAIAQSTGNRVIGNTVDGVSGIGGILVDDSTNVIVQGNTVLNTKGSSTTGHGMYIAGSSVGVEVLDNVVHDNGYIGIHVNGDVSEGLPGYVKGAVIAGNLIYKNGQNGINADGLESSTISNNVIYGNAFSGIELYQIDAYGGSTGNVIVNNTIDQSAGDYAIAVSPCAFDNQSSTTPTPTNCSAAPMDSSTGNIAFNNILLGKSGDISTVTSADVAAGSNLSSATAGLFVDSASGNYQLAPAGPGIGKGIATFSGASAPAAANGAYDIGAFAFAHP